MAANWNLRKSVIGHADNVVDVSVRLRTYMDRNNYLDKPSIFRLMEQVRQHHPALIGSHLQACIERAETSRLASEALIEVLNSEKKRQEAQYRLSVAVEKSTMKQEAKEQRILQYRDRGDIATRMPPWNLLANPDDNQSDNPDDNRME